jgi:hypothetical protein
VGVLVVTRTSDVYAPEPTFMLARQLRRGDVVSWTSVLQTRGAVPLRAGRVVAVRGGVRVDVYGEGVLCVDGGTRVAVHERARRRLRC